MTHRGNSPTSRPTRAPRIVWGRRSVAFAAVAATVSLLAAACGSSLPAAASKASSRKTPGGPYLTMGMCCGWTSWSYNPFSSNFPGFASDLVYLPLALQIPPKISGYEPQLATSWKMSGTKLVIRLRGGVHWQDGKSFTSKDVYDTFLLDGTEGAGGWSDFSDISAPNAHEVVLTIRKGVPAANLEAAVLGVTPYPASVYGSYITPKLKSEEIAYYNLATESPSSAANSPEGKALSSVFTKLAADHPPTMIGDGPFRLVNMTLNEAKLARWSGFYDASKVHIAGIDYKGATENQLIYPWLLHGIADFSNVFMPPAIVSQWLKTRGAHIAIPHAFQFDLTFDARRYPLNMVKVRQALAYVMPRSTMVRTVYGTVDPDAAVEPHPDGMAPWQESLYLSKAQIAKLNTYPLDPAKATSLLKSAGFHKSKGQWITPEGKPFTLTVYIQSAASDVVSSMDIASKAFSAFGIKTTLTAIPSASVTPDLEQGSSDLAWVTDNNLNPLIQYDNILGHTDNFPNIGTYKGDQGIGFGPTVKVPGLGVVNVPDTLDAEAASVPPGPKMNKLVWDWARLVNQDLPYLQWQNKLHQYPYSTRNFTDWPPVGKDGTSPLWDVFGYNLNGGLLLSLERGYLRPHS